MPDQWRKDLTQANGEITIRVETGDDATPAQIKETVNEALADPAISHWRLHTCHPLPTDSAPGEPSEDIP
ncbi:hypothetical protein AB0B89_02080 [Sphaerisporangium sp. NPDC049002]|uniref:hypothetical protein n=1 Tax=unclassified Sphaerisporangium TaxID=2630420 RepID=UPI0033F20EA4